VQTGRVRPSGGDVCRRLRARGNGNRPLHRRLSPAQDSCLDRTQDASAGRSVVDRFSYLRPAAAFSVRQTTGSCIVSVIHFNTNHEKTVFWGFSRVVRNSLNQFI